MASTLCSSLLDFTSLAPETNCFSLQQDLSCLRNLQLALISNLFLLCSCQGARFRTAHLLDEAARCGSQ